SLFKARTTAGFERSAERLSSVACARNHLHRKKEKKMATIHFHETTKSTPEQFLAALTDFGPGRSKIFGNSADDYLEVHDEGANQADVTEARTASGNACTTTGPIRPMSSSRPRTPTCGEATRVIRTGSRRRPTDRPTSTSS